MTLTRNNAGPVAIAVAALALLAASPAAAQRTYQVAGRQVIVNEDAGTYKMRGGLRGDFAVTSFKELATEPLYRAEGTERFRGCLDRRRDRSCAGDPSGTLSFSFLYWGSSAPGTPGVGLVLASGRERHRRVRRRRGRPDDGRQPDRVRRRLHALRRFDHARGPCGQGASSRARRRSGAAGLLSGVARGAGTRARPGALPSPAVRGTLEPGEGVKR